MPLMLAALVAACVPTPRHADSSPNPVPSLSKSASPPSAPLDASVHYQYYFDRNALASSVIVGPNVIALTQSGHILRFDKVSFALTAEQFFSRRARVMGGADATSVLIGFEGGRIARVDAASFSLETVTMVPGTPMWVGRSKAGEPVVVFASRKVGTGPLWREYENYRIWLAARNGEAPIVLPSEKRIGGPAETFFLDSRDRLWHGADRGEWGGSMEVVDLKSGEVRQLPGANWGGYGVYGFAESSQGKVFAFGGVTHMGWLESFVANVEPDNGSRLYAYEGMGPFDAARRKRWAAAPEPHLPVTYVLERGNGTFWLLSFSYLIEANARFRRFRHIHDFSLHYTPGRPDAVGSYPAIVSAMLDGDRLLLATRNDGFVEFANDAAVAHAVPDQVAGEIAACVPTPAGLLFLRHFGGSLLARNSHWKDFEMEVAQEGDKILIDPEVPITDPDILSARSAYEAWVRRRRSEPGHPGARARIEWDERTDLFATDKGMCMLARGGDTCSPFTLPGVDKAVLAFARDNRGRLWLAGEGLWVVEKDGTAIAVHPKLPFMTDSVIRDVQIVDGKLVLSLGDRGVAVVDAGTVGTN